MIEQIKNDDLKDVKKELYLISFFMFLLTSVYTSFSMILVYIHQSLHHRGYAQANLTCNSLSFLLLSFFAPNILRKNYISNRNWFTLCAFCYFLNVFVPALFSAEEVHNQKDIPSPSGWRIVLEGSANIVGGGASGILWVLFGLYLNGYCEKMQINIRGNLVSTSSIIINIRNILAPLLTITGLGYGNSQIFFIILSIIGFIAVLFPYLFISEQSFKQTPIIDESQENIDDVVNERNQQISLKVYCQYVFRMRHFLPSCILTGIMYGFITSSIAHLLPESKNKIQIGSVLLFYGIGSIGGSWLCGLSCDRFKENKKMALIGAIVPSIIASIIDSIILYSEAYTTLYASTVSLILSFSISYITCFMIFACTTYFHGDAQSFAISKQTTAISFLSYQWIVTFANKPSNMRIHMIYQSCLIGLLAIFSFWAIVKSNVKIKTLEQALPKIQMKTQVNKQIEVEVKIQKAQQQE